MIVLDSLLRDYFELVCENGKEFAVCAEASCSFRASRASNKSVEELTSTMEYLSHFDSLQAKRIQETSS